MATAFLIAWLLVKLAGILLAMQFVSAALVAAFIVPPYVTGDWLYRRYRA